MVCLFSLPGIPCVYYGTEQGLHGHGSDPAIREAIWGAPGFDQSNKFFACRLDAYQDDAGVWTIGYGHIAGVTEGMTITQAQADAFLWDDAAHTLTVLNALTAGVATLSYQFDAPFCHLN
jgi:GH24 family phage-related lysozyme (muramidase)